jgi:hypothetical protein
MAGWPGIDGGRGVARRGVGTTSEIVIDWAVPCFSRRLLTFIAGIWPSAFFIRIGLH